MFFDTNTLENFAKLFYNGLQELDGFLHEVQKEKKGMLYKN